MKTGPDSDCGSVMSWLKEEDPVRLDHLFRSADMIRRENVGDEVHLRGLIEISNNCVRHCAYCGLRAGNTGLERYRMNSAEILSCALEAHRLGLGTVVLQGGEDYGLSEQWVGSIIGLIKERTPLAVTLSLGERSERELEAWREAGADRYFIRFETSDMELYGRIHPSLPSRPVNRIEMLKKLQSTGYQTGSGVMVGIPGQTYASLARDILLFRELDLDMIGVGPWLPHPATPLGARELQINCPAGEQAPNTEIMTCKVVALARLCCPQANIPSTTALAVLNEENGYEAGLGRGANVIMPSLTPIEHYQKYEIYPKKIVLSDAAKRVESICSRIESIGRPPGRGPGNRLNRELRLENYQLKSALLLRS